MNKSKRAGVVVCRPGAIVSATRTMEIKSFGIELHFWPLGEQGRSWKLAAGS
jgi:hypothetical protein